MDYELRRSNRKSIGLEVTEDGLIVRAPRHASVREIERIIAAHQGWIDKGMARRERIRLKAREAGLLTEEDIRRLAKEAKDYIPGRVSYYAGQLGVHPGRITIRHQKTRWGSCSARQNLNFNCLLMLMPAEVIDSVVVHELCHILEMNHSPRFYEHVLRVFPDYHRHHGWLKAHGPEIMARMPGL